MLQYFHNLLVSFSPSDDTGYEANQLHLAAAVLLVEVMMADHNIKQEEVRRIAEALENVFGISREQTSVLIDEASHRHNELVSLQEMTSIINEQQDQELKRQLVYAMWCVALADDEKDKYEEHMIRKVADLLYLSHSDFIKARHRAEDFYNK